MVDITNPLPQISSNPEYNWIVTAQKAIVFAIICGVLVLITHPIASGISPEVKVVIIGFIVKALENVYKQLVAYPA